MSKSKEEMEKENKRLAWVLVGICLLLLVYLFGFIYLEFRKDKSKTIHPVAGVTCYIDKHGNNLGCVKEDTP